MLSKVLATFCLAVVYIQRRWTWLYDARNSICKDDRIALIKKVKELVYSKSELLLDHLYQEFLADPLCCKYPSFLEHIKSLWPCRKEWAHCYRQSLMVRGNHTNNYTEAGMRVLKELIF